MTLKEFVNRAVTVPFCEKGRDYLGWDCWGAVYCGYRDVLGIHLPSYVEDYVDAGNSPATRRALNDLILSQLQQWQAVQARRPMDVVLITLGVDKLHVGLLVNKREFIHCEKKVGTVVERVDSVIWRHRIEGIYRPAEGGKQCPV